MRRWKVSIYSVDDTEEHGPLNYVEKVEYVLHPTFEPPERGNEDFFFENDFTNFIYGHQINIIYIVVRKPPFTLSEKGWGEFDMKIVLYFTDKSVQPFTLNHDLNFKKSHYEVTHKLVSIVNILFVHNTIILLNK